MRRGAPARRTRGRLSQSRQAVPVSRRPACLGHRILGQHQHQPTRRKHRHHGGYGPVPASQGPSRRHSFIQSRLRRLAARMTSLADLQAERDKLRALDAKEEFEAALAETCAHAELQAAALAVRRVLLAALEGLPARLAQALAGERDETRAHYLMSDAAHGLLSALGHEVEAASAPLPVVGERFRRGAKPRDLLTVSQWADRHRWLRSGTNAPGRWSTALTPYLREIMDGLSEHSPVRSVVFIKSSGVGGTEALYNWLGYVMHHLANKDMLVVVPTLELRDRAFNPRLAKMLDESEALAGLVTTAARNRANRGDLLEYGARARIIKAGANSPDSLRSDHLPYVICAGSRGIWPRDVLKKVSRGLSRVEAGHPGVPRLVQVTSRSEERRVGKECRSRWSPYH